MVGGAVAVTRTGTAICPVPAASTSTRRIGAITELDQLARNLPPPPSGACGSSVEHGRSTRACLGASRLRLRLSRGGCQLPRSAPMSCVRPGTSHAARAEPAARSGRGQRRGGRVGGGRVGGRRLSCTAVPTGLVPPADPTATPLGTRCWSTPEAVAPESLPHRRASSHAAERSWANGCRRYQQRIQSRRALAPRVSRGEPASGRRACFRPHPQQTTQACAPQI